MTKGIAVDLPELIALRRFAKRVDYKPDNFAARSGNHLSKLRGRGMDFAEVRNYQAGDEVRHMEWRVTARSGKPHVKIYQEERERPVVILTDFSSSMHFGTRDAFKSTVGARLAAMIAWVAVLQGDWVGGMAFSEEEHREFMPQGRSAGVMSLLGAYCDYSKRQAKLSTSCQSMLHALKRLRRVARPGSLIVLISDFYQFNDEVFSHLTRLRQHNDILAYFVCDSLELGPPKPQKYGVTNGVSDIIFDTTNNRVNKAYQEYCDKRIQNIEEKFKKLQIQCAQVTAQMDIPLLVRQTYPRRKNA